MNPARRIQKEIADIQNDKQSSLTIEVIDGEFIKKKARTAGKKLMSVLLQGNIRHLIGTFPGPEGSPYQGGLFKVVGIARDVYFRFADFGLRTSKWWKAIRSNL
jgi:ubiquitin-protein ligase